MLTLYGVSRSRASRNIWLLGEIGMAFDQVPVIQAYRLADPHAAGAPLNTLSPEFLAISPAGAVPALRDGDLVLSESLAMNLYLARTYGGELGPKTPVEDALMQQWALYAATAAEPHSIGIYYANRDHGAGTPAARAAIRAVTDILRRPLAVIDQALAGSGHLVGGRFTVADINMAEVLRYTQPEAAFLAEFPALDAWLKACQARPAFKAMWERRLAEPE
jgi:glutathione S-transferase